KVVEPKPLRKRVMPFLAAVVLTAAITVAAVRFFERAVPTTLTRFLITLGAGQQFSSSNRTLVAISPDGTQIVYEANRRLYHRLMSDLDARPIPGTEAANGTFITNPVFSPDGRSIVFYFSQEEVLKKIAVTGGAAVTICQAGAPYGVSWGPDG